jgi:PD-(D/E)XK nuclease superfamily
VIRSISIDFSTLNLWRTCPQKFAYQTLMSLAPLGQEESSALTFGKLAHLGIELLNNTKSTPNPGSLEEIEYLVAHNPPHPVDGFLGVLNKVTSEASKTPLFRLLPDERRSLRHLLLLLHHYVNKWHPEMHPAKVSEKKHKVFLGYTSSGIQVFYTGTIDGISYDNKILERKTTSYLDAGFINKINPNAQACGYITLARDLLKDDTIDTVIFDALSTTGYGKSFGALTSRPDSWKLNKDPNSLFLRIETMRQQAHLDEWRENVLYDAERMVQDIIRGKFAAHDPDPCTAYNSTCPYINICRAVPSARSNLIENTMQTSIWESFQINRDFVK